MTGVRGNGGPKAVPGVLVPRQAPATPSGVPSWAGLPRTSKYDNLTGVYGGTEARLSRSRIALAKAASRTAKCNILTIGDSTLIGYNGARAMERYSLARQLATCLARATGAPVDGGMIVPPGAASTSNDRFIYTGTYFLTYPFAMLGTSATMTYESELAGTDIQIWYTDNSSNWSYSIDGATAVNVVPTAGTDVKSVTVTGLSDTTHRITITSAGNYTYICALGVFRAGSISPMNWGYGGSRAGVDVSNSWTVGSAGTSLKVSRELLRTATGGIPDPDLLIIGIGGNDMFQGDEALAAVAAVKTMRNWWPNADCILLMGVYFSGSSATNVARYSEAKYQLADDLNCVVVDQRELLKSSTYAIAQGALGVDNAHPIDGMTSELARLLGDLISGAGAYSPQNTPPVIHYKTTTSPVITSAMDGGFIQCSNASATALTVPTNSTDPIPIGATFEGVQYGAGVVTITAAGGVTIRNTAGLKANGQYAVFGLRKIGTNEWVAYGDLTT